MLFVLSKLARTNYPRENGCVSISSSPCRLRSKMNWHATSPGWHGRTRPSRDDRSAPFVFHRRAVDRGLAEGLADRAAKVPGRLFHDLHRNAVRHITRAGGPETRSMFGVYNIAREDRESLCPLRHGRDASRLPPPADQRAVKRNEGVPFGTPSFFL